MPRFATAGAAVDAAIGGAFGVVRRPRGGLRARRFTRSIYRDAPRAFAGDARALAIAQATVGAGDDNALGPYERWFLYMPYQHAEDPAAQQRSIALFTRWRDENGLAGPLEWAEKHAAIIRRFGRYPHRNAILSRQAMTKLRFSGTRIAVLKAFCRRPGATATRSGQPAGPATRFRCCPAISQRFRTRWQLSGILGGAFDPIHTDTSSSPGRRWKGSTAAAPRFPTGDPPHRLRQWRPPANDWQW